MRRVVQTAFGCLLLTGTLTGQSDPSFDSYRKAVAAYQRGDFHIAADTLLALPTEDVKRLVASAVREAPTWKAAAGAPGVGLDPKQRAWIEAAAMLHTELALRDRVTTAPDIASQFDLAEVLVRSLPIGDSGRGSRTSPFPNDSDLFQQKWYQLVSSCFLYWRRPDLAVPYVDRGLRLFPGNAPLRMRMGVVEETRAYLDDGNLHDRRSIAARAQTEARGRLELAEGHYRRALSLDPELMEARLRLGRLLFLRREPGAARRELQTVESHTKALPQRYLAHLFVGAVYEYENDVTNARRQYEAALLLAPLCQTPYVALGFLERSSGRLTRSAEVFAALAALPKPAVPDPWWDYPSGAFDEDAARWLRTHVASPVS